jgi:hypothetical protein
MQKIFLLLLIFPIYAHAVPIDWHGVFGVDTTLIDNYRRIESKIDNSATTGSQEVSLASGAHANASFQSYLFRLNPTMIINDAATFKGELTSGYGRGGRLGDDSTRSFDDDMGNALYLNNSASGSNSLIINKLFVELYSDTATYVIGRHSAHWGLGVLVNSGDDTWDRHTFIRDGITLKFKIGNFKIEPYWSKVSSNSSLTRSSKVKEYGFSLLYDNNDSDLALGILFGKKASSKFDTSITRDLSTTPTTPLGETDIKLTDLYFKKGFGNLSLALEVPILSGDLGFAFAAGQEAKYKAKAIIFKGQYQASDSWAFAVDAGTVSGESGQTNSYDAMYLNPNYQVAKLLFRYNRRAISDTTKNIFDSYITNALFAKLGMDYSSESWVLKTAFIWAVANETATAGQTSFNHTKNQSFTAVTTQDDQLGYELDLSIDYKWNNEITVGSSAAYLFTGDYWAYTNTATKNVADNSFLLQLRTSIDF